MSVMVAFLAAIFLLAVLCAMFSYSQIPPTLNGKILGIVLKTMSMQFGKVNIAFKVSQCMQELELFTFTTINSLSKRWGYLYAKWQSKVNCRYSMLKD
jgi:hypothetical protein